jgi:O-antigen ligase
MRAQAESDFTARVPGPSWREFLPYALTLCAYTAFSFLSGGYILTRAAPIAIAWLLVAAVGVWVVRGWRRPSWLYVGALAALAAYTVWAGVSILWSFGPDLSWVAFDYAAFYLAVAAVLGATATGRHQLRLAGYGFLVATIAVALYAFAGKALPDVVTHAHTYARLDSPVGYWNVLALLMVMALPVALSLAGRRGAPLALRAAAAAGAVPLAFTFVFSFSRGGVLALIVVLVAYFALADRRLTSLAALIAVAVPVAAALWRVRELDTLFSATDDEVLRTAQGHDLLRWALLALVATVVLHLVFVALERAVPWPRWARVAAGAVVLAGIVIGVGGGALVYVDRQGGAEWVRERYRTFVEDADTRSTADTADRLLSLNSGRPPLWRRALEQYDAGPKVGTGAGTYRFTHYRFRRTGGVTKHAHSQWLNALSELGAPGLLTFAASMALFVTATLRGLIRGRRDPERSLLAALQAGLIAFIVHMTWDWDWDMAAAGVAMVLFAATAAAYVSTRDAGHAAALAAETPGAAAAAPPDAGADVEGAAAPDAGVADAPGASQPALRVQTKGVAPRVFASGLLVLVAVSWLPPSMADRAQNRAVEEAARGEIAAAADAARSARRWNPLAADPLITLALVEQQLGQNRAALETLRDAARLQPENYEVHYQLGLLLERAFGRDAEAAREFRRALQLNPLHSSSRYELEALAGGG